MLVGNLHAAVFVLKKVQLKCSHAAQNNPKDNLQASLIRLALPSFLLPPPPPTHHPSSCPLQGKTQRRLLTKLMYERVAQFLCQQSVFIGMCVCVCKGGCMRVLGRGRGSVRLHIFAAFVNIFVDVAAVNDFAAKLKCIRNLLFESMNNLYCIFCIPCTFVVPLVISVFC